MNFFSELLSPDERTELHLSSFTASIFLDSKTRIGQVRNLMQPEIAARRKARQNLNLNNNQKIQEPGFILVNRQVHFKDTVERLPRLAYGQS